MEKGRMELSVGGRSLAEAEIQRCILQGYALLPLQFVTTMRPLNHILGKCTGIYKLSK